MKRRERHVLSTDVLCIKDFEEKLILKDNNDNNIRDIPSGIVLLRK